MSGDLGRAVGIGWSLYFAASSTSRVALGPTTIPRRPSSAAYGRVERLLGAGATRGWSYMISNRLVDIGPLVFGGVFAVIALLAALALIPIIIIVANRAEPDARGVRPFSVYLFGLSF